MSVQAKLIVGGAILLGVTVYVASLGASASWQYYLTVDECLADAASFRGRQVRISGSVARGSLRIGPDRRSAEFVLAGLSASLPTSCQGPLPDNLAEEIPVVVEGRLATDGSLHGDKVLTRCASKYDSGGPSNTPVEGR